jgi:hypothetical protein
MSVTEISPPTSTHATEEGAFLRLASCPRCDSRRRALVEVNGRLRGRCLACGEELGVPLAVETHQRLELVGRPPGRSFRESGD